MENASKALIIAGAILLSILLISLGIMVYNQAQSAIDGSGMSDAELTAFNAKWLKYEGRQKGSTIKAMAQEVMANNNNEEASDETYVTITGAEQSPLVTLKQNETTKAWDLSYDTNFKNTKIYTVTFTYTNGRITSISVT